MNSTFIIKLILIIGGLFISVSDITGYDDPIYHTPIRWNRLRYPLCHKDETIGKKTNNATRKLKRHKGLSVTEQLYSKRIQVLNINSAYVQTDPDLSPETMLLKAVEFRNEALSIADSTIKSNRYLTEKLYEESITLFEKCIKLYPFFPDCSYELGRTLYAFGDTQGAIDQFKNALKKDPHYYPAHLGLGLSFYRLGEDEKAINHLKEYIKHDPPEEYALQAKSILQKIDRKK